MAFFEGFFNFLSYLTLYLQTGRKFAQFSDSNSTSFFDKNIPRMLEHNCVYLYPGNDKTGQNCRPQVVKFDQEKFQDERWLYQ